MWIALGLLAPVVGFVLLFVWNRRSAETPLPEIAAGVAALWCFVAVAWLLTGKDRWPQTTQIAWTGIDKRVGPSSPSLVIGGSEQGAVVGWPNGSFDPLLRVEPIGNSVHITTTRGGAFVLSRPGREILNGLEIPDQRSRIVDGYRFELPVRWWIIPEPVRRWCFASYHLRVFGPGGELLTDVQLSRPGPAEKYHFVGLDVLSARSPKEVLRNAVFENWSHSTLIAVTRTGLRVLNRSSVSLADCQLPCAISLKWRRLTLNADIDVDNGRTVRVRFERPWRRVCPLPERVDGARRIVVTREARPGDSAFLLPLGGGAWDERSMLQLTEDDGVPRFSTWRPRQSIASVRRPEEQVVVTSETGVPAGDYTFKFATSVDILHPGVVVFRLFVALVVMLGGLVVLRPRIAPQHRWLIAGIAVVFFAILSFRVALAVRYALAPGVIVAIAIMVAVSSRTP